LRAGIESRAVDYGFCVPQGEHKGWVGIKPVATDRSRIELPAERNTLGMQH